MSVREFVGLLMIVLGFAITPVAWAYYHLLWGICMLLIGGGAYLFHTERVSKKLEEIDKENRYSSRNSNCNAPMPSDVFNYTGWRSLWSKNDKNDRSDDHDSGGSDSD